MQQYVIIVSTFQVISNLALTCELCTGNENIVLLSSPEVTYQTQAFVQFAENRQLSVSTYLINDQPRDIVKLVCELLPEPHACQVKFICNGGTKYTFLAVTEALKEFDYTLYYGDRNPYYSKIAGGINETMTTHYYERSDFTLKEFFALNGLRFADEPKQHQVWPICSAYIPEVEYGQSTQKCIAIHDQKYLHETLFSQSATKNNIKAQDIVSIYPDGLEIWRTKIASCLNSLLGLISDHKVHIMGSDITDNDAQVLFDLAHYDNFDLVQALIVSSEIDESRTVLVKPFCARLVNTLKSILVTKHVKFDKVSLTDAFCLRVLRRKGCRNLMVFYLSALRDQQAFFTVFLGRGDVGEWKNLALGPQFESAVFKRATDFLFNNHAQVEKVIHSAWINIKTFNNKKYYSELDFLLVTKNATLIHLEAKSFTADKKDMQSRMNTLQHSSSTVSKTFVVSPIFPNCMNRSWEKRIHQFTQDMQATKGMLNIVFNCNDKPFTYHLHNTTQSGVKTSFDVQPFEQSLQNIISDLLIKA